MIDLFFLEPKPIKISFRTVVARMKAGVTADREEWMCVLATLLNSWDERERFETLLAECSSLCKNKVGKPISIQKARERAVKNGDDDDGLLETGELVKKYHSLLLLAPQSVQELYLERLQGSEFKKQRNELLGVMKDKQSPPKKKSVGKTFSRKDQEAKDSAKTKTSKKRQREPRFHVGHFYEAELDGSNQLYKDVIHPVMVLEYDEKKNSYECQLAAFWEDAIDWYQEDQLHEFRDPDEVARDDWEAGDLVHVRIRGRIAVEEDEPDVDGKMSRVGVWVKGKIIRVNKEDFVVEHTTWGGSGGMDEHVASIDDLRAPY